MSTSKTRDLPAGWRAFGGDSSVGVGRISVRSRIPDSLWAAAVKMAGTYGIRRTARALRVDYYSLKKRVEQDPAAAADLPEGGAVATFLELAPPASAGPCECTLELEDAGGAKMRVHLKGVATPDLAALSRSFWNPAP